MCGCYGALPYLAAPNVKKAPGSRLGPCAPFGVPMHEWEVHRLDAGWRESVTGRNGWGFSDRNGTAAPWMRAAGAIVLDSAEA